MTATSSSLFLSKPAWLIVAGCLLLVSINANAALRFFGDANNDDQRVKIQIDVLPPDSSSGPPADIGAEDFTLEFWMKAASADNINNSGLLCGANNNWIWGNIIIDRDRYEQGRSYGVSIDNGMLRFGADNIFNQTYTICGTTNVLDNQWHHVAVQRRISDGLLQLYLDGSLEAEFDGPDGDISYPDDGVPNNTGCGGPCTFSDPYLVIGAEKHDLADDYNGLLSEVRLSNTLRYPASVPSQVFITDINTVALYHFDEGTGTIANDTSGAPGGPSHGEIRTGVVWSADSPFTMGGIPGTIQFTETVASIVENIASRAFNVTRSGGNGSVSIDYAITDGTAMAGSDYQLSQQVANGTLSWNDNDLSTQTLTIDIVFDSSPENDETVFLTLSNPTGGASLGINSAATLTIQDDDSAGSLEFANAIRTVDEDAGTVMIIVNRVNGTSGVVTVSYTNTAATTASLGEDYASIQPASSVLTFLNGATTASITIPVIDDTASETLEEIVLLLENPGGGAGLGTVTQMTLSIRDNDSQTPPTSNNNNSGGGALNPLFLILLLFIFNRIAKISEACPRAG